jgi:DNA methyltransferase 1-associated protein 1
MPTRESCAQLESLLDATTALVETKKAVDKVEYGIQVLKARLGIRTSEGADGNAVTGADAGASAGDAMDVDEGNEGGEAEAEVEAEVDDGRAQSVVSTRSTRSRKHVGVLDFLTYGSY